MRRISVYTTLCAVLCAGCAERHSESDTKFWRAKASAAVAFAEAELALSPDDTRSVKRELTSSEPPSRRRRLLYFTATWCSTCRENEPTLAALAAAGWSIGTSDRDHIQIVDVDASPSVVKQLGIEAVPVWVLVDDDVVIRRAVGVLDPFAVGKMFEAKK